MSIFDYFLLAGLLGLIVAASWDDGRLCNRLWFGYIQPAIDKMEAQAAEQNRQIKK